MAETGIRELFRELRTADPRWLSAVRAEDVNQATLALRGQQFPELRLSTKVAPMLSQTGAVDPSVRFDPTVSIPFSPTLSVLLPVWSPEAMDERSLSILEQQASAARFRELEQDQFADFVLILASIVSAEAIVDLHRVTAASLTDLMGYAERRRVLGAGSTKDVVRAKVAARQLEASVQTESAKIQDYFAAWQADARTVFENNGGAGRYRDPAYWTSLLDSWGLDATELFNSASESTASTAVPSLPELVERDSRAAGHRVAAEALRQAKQGAGLAISVYGNVGAVVALSPTGQAAFDYNAQTGIALEWPLLSRSSSDSVQRLALRSAESQSASIDEQEALRIDRVSILAQEFTSAVKVLRLRREIRRAAVEDAGSLEAELVAGASTIDAVLQGIQMLYQAKEDEVNAQWNAVGTAVRHLKFAGRVRL